jgi:hypothetical protein
LQKFDRGGGGAGPESQHGGDGFAQLAIGRHGGDLALPQGNPVFGEFVWHVP